MSDSEHRVLIPKDVARRYLFNSARPEYRFSVICFDVKTARFQSWLLKKFRSAEMVGRSSPSLVKLGTVEPILDLGVDVRGDTLSVWSSNRKGLLALKDCYENSGFETTGIW